MNSISIFVSYSHKNSRWCDERNEYNLIPFLIESLKYKNVQIWYDHDLATLPGIDYERKIKSEIDSSKIAILLLSRDFINSEFIMKTELPWIKARLENKQIEIIPILIEPWTVPPDHEAYWLLKNQIIPGSAEPLSNSLGMHHVFLNKRIQILEALERIINLMDKKQIPPSPGAIKPLENKFWNKISNWLSGNKNIRIVNQTYMQKLIEPEMDGEKYRATILTQLVLLRTNPIENFVKQAKIFENLIQIAEKNPSYYFENFKTESSILFRIYGAGKTISANDPKIPPSSNFKSYFPFIKKSYELEKEVWKSEDERHAYKFLLNTEKNLSKTDFTKVDFLKEYLGNLLIALMYAASKDELEREKQKFLLIFTSMTDVLKFFYEYQIGKTNYRLIVEAIKMLIINMGSELKGPDIEIVGGTYLIKYWMNDANGTIKHIIWEVNMNKKEVNPFNEHAKTFTDAIRKKGN